MSVHSPELERLLRKWGRVFGQAPPPEWDEGDVGGETLFSLFLQRMRTGASSGKRDDSLWSPTPADRFTGKAAPPADRVTARAVQSKPKCGAIRSYTDPEAEAIDIAAIELWKQHLVRGVVLRVEYCTRGSRKEKAPLAAHYACLARLPVSRYRWELDMARAWMEGWIFQKMKNVA